MSEVGERIWTVDELADRWHVSPYTVAAATRDGRLRKLPLGRIRITDAARREFEAGYDDGRAKHDGQAPAKATPSWPRKRRSPQGPLAGETVGGGDPVHRLVGPTPGDVVIRRVPSRGVDELIDSLREAEDLPEYADDEYKGRIPGR